MQCSQEPSPLQQYFWIFHLLPWAVHIFYIHLLLSDSLLQQIEVVVLKKKISMVMSVYPWCYPNFYENLGSKKRIQNFSLEVTLKIQTGFCVLGSQCFHASMLRCNKTFTRDNKILLNSSQIELWNSFSFTCYSLILHKAIPRQALCFGICVSYSILSTK